MTPLKISNRCSVEFYSIPLLEALREITPWIWVDAKEAEVLLIDNWTKLKQGEYSPSALVIGVSGESYIRGCLPLDFELGSHLASKEVGRKTWMPYIPLLGNPYTEPPLAYVEDVEERKDVCWISSRNIPYRTSFVKRLMTELMKEGVQVDCLGACLHNTPRFRGNWHNTPKIYKNYRFTITLENKLKDGYITEKVGNALIARSVPIILRPRHLSLFPYPDEDDWCVRVEGEDEVGECAKKVLTLLEDEEGYRKMMGRNPLLHSYFWNGTRQIKKGVGMLVEMVVEEVEKRREGQPSP